VGLVAGSLAVQAQLAHAQVAVSQAILVLNQERLLTESKKGRLLLDEEDAVKTQRNEDAARIEAELEAEERALAEQRKTMDADAFDALAEAFDQKVVALRLEDQRVAEQLSTKFEDQRKAFFADIVPIVAEIMREQGASVVLEQRNVLFTGPNVDITPQVIERMDKAAGLN
jgi:Skp family chaperone for outer membrane proteins